MGHRTGPGWPTPMKKFQKNILTLSFTIILKKNVKFMDSPYIYIRVKNPADAVNLSLLDFHFCCIIKPKRMCPSTTHSLYLRMKQRCEKIRACFEK